MNFRQISGAFSWKTIQTVLSREIRCVVNPNLRMKSSFEASLLKEEPLIRRILRKLPFARYEETRLKASGYFLYEEIADKVNYVEFFEELDLPDTFYSWFVITELHIWMVSARTMAEGNDGRILRNAITEALWYDVKERTKALGAINSAVKNEQIGELSDQLNAAIVAYDEGLLGDDTILAGALWRRFFQQQEIDLTRLNLLVKYVRKQMRLLDFMSKEQIFEKRVLTWDPLS